MRFRDLVEATYIQDIKRAVKNSLVALKIEGMQKVETQQVLKDFARRGSPMTFQELVNFIGDDPMIKDMNIKFITFNQPNDSLQVSSKDKVEDNKARVQQLSKKSLKKDFE